MNPVVRNFLQENKGKNYCRKCITLAKNGNIKCEEIQIFPNCTVHTFDKIENTKEDKSGGGKVKGKLAKLEKEDFSEKLEKEDFSSIKGYLSKAVDACDGLAEKYEDTYAYGIQLWREVAYAEEESKSTLEREMTTYNVRKTPSTL